MRSVHPVRDDRDEPTAASDPASAGSTGTTGRLVELYARCVPPTIGFAYLLCGDRAAAEDLVHDAFVRVSARLGRLRDANAFDAYLLRTVVNLHTSRLRHLRVERRYLERQQAVRPAIVALPDVGEREFLWHALERLTPRQRAVVVLRYYEDLSERETADVMRCSVAAVKSLTARAMQTLRDAIGDDR